MQMEPITSLFTQSFTAILSENLGPGNFILFFLLFCLIHFFLICFCKTASSYFGILLQNSILNKSDHCRCPSPTPGGVIMLLY